METNRTDFTAPSDFVALTGEAQTSLGDLPFELRIYIFKIATQTAKKEWRERELARVMRYRKQAVISLSSRRRDQYDKLYKVQLAPRLSCEVQMYIGYFYSTMIYISRQRKKVEYQSHFFNGIESNKIRVDEGSWRAHQPSGGYLANCIHHYD